MAKVLFCTLTLCAVAAAQLNSFNDNLVGRTPSSSVAQSELAQTQATLQTRDSLSQIDLARLEAKLLAIIDVNRRALRTAGDIAEASIRSVLLEHVDDGWRDDRIGRNGRDGINGNRGSSSIGTQTNTPLGSRSGSGRPGQQSSGSNNADNVSVAGAGSQQNSGNNQ
ncbi:hypothetical protein FOCC_FOCC016338 [Frankliniella occidentalis]|uniref:Uncharacterized protein LOC113208574 n=1 Tax=Frankliniella occidentalis TaxID=133901 RepID=A0A6J1SSC9_FRAOC|nr:uncharacterized protein LOC113208574 [Frankliniella occidentalis]KAE8738192.1 hypothetical protein FOCC_FOCC016338 [Frankliniella occidentalis]